MSRSRHAKYRLADLCVDRQLMKDAINGAVPGWSTCPGRRGVIHRSARAKRRNNQDPRSSKNSDAESRSQSVFGTISILDAAALSNLGDGSDGSALVIKHPALVDEYGNTVCTVPVNRERRSD